MMNTRFVSLGECMVELSPTGQADQFRRAFSGDTFNTAWYLRRCLPADWAVDYVTAVGTDAISDRMIAFMAGAGVGTRHIARHSGRTVGLYLIELQDGERSFVYWRGESAARLLAQDRAELDHALHAAGFVYFSGITMAILSPPDRATLLAAIAAARLQGARVAFDPNLRPRLWPSTDEMRKVITEASGHADLILPSFEDEAVHFGDADPQATAARYHAGGAQTVVVKNGADEILASHDGAVTRWRPPAVARIVDTTAAGDSFNAGFLAQSMAGKSIDDALKYGSALAAKVIAGPGALVQTDLFI
jgi:2-dehydro-3-deoxygluconokinase